MPNVRVSWNEAEIRRLLLGADGPVGMLVTKSGQAVTAEAKRRCPVATGKLRASGTTTTAVRGQSFIASVAFTAPYVMYVHQGTGIYAGRGMIKPKRGRFLVFTPGKAMGPALPGARRNAGGKVFARQVRGIPPSPFLLDAARAALPWPVTVTG